MIDAFDDLALSKSHDASSFFEKWNELVKMANMMAEKYKEPLMVNLSVTLNYVNVALTMPLSVQNKSKIIYEISLEISKVMNMVNHEQR